MFWKKVDFNWKNKLLKYFVRICYKIDRIYLNVFCMVNVVGVFLLKLIN